MGTKKKAKKKSAKRAVAVTPASLKRLSSKVEAEVERLMEQERAGVLTGEKLETGLQDLTEKIAQLNVFIHKMR